MISVKNSRIRQIVQEELALDMFLEAQDFRRTSELNSYVKGRSVVGYSNMGRKQLSLVFSDGASLFIDALGWDVENGRARVSSAKDAGSFAVGKTVEAAKIEETNRIVDCKIKFRGGQVLVAEDLNEVSKPNWADYLEPFFNQMKNEEGEPLGFELRAQDTRKHGKLVGTYDGNDIEISNILQTRDGGYKVQADMSGDMFSITASTPHDLVMKTASEADNYTSFFGSLF
jgi:hypothetical protein